MSNELEIKLREVGRLLHDHQVARIYKIPEEFKRTPADFGGWTISGRAVLIEAKMVTKTYLSLLPHQWVSLQEVQQCGGIGLVAWQRDEDRLAIFDADVAKVLMKNRRSIPWKGLGKWTLDEPTSPYILKSLEWWLNPSKQSTPRGLSTSAS